MVKLGSLNSIVFVILSLFVVRNTTSNILGLFPHCGYSHFKVFYPILQGLAERGHKVTIVTYVKNPKPHPNYVEILLTGEDILNVVSVHNYVVSRSFSVLIDEFWALRDEGQKSCEIFYTSGAVEKILKRHSEEPYDMVMLENFNTDCYLGIPHILNLPFVGLSSCALMPWYYDRVGLPDTPSYIQSEFIGFPEPMEWADRLKNFVATRIIKLLYRLTEYSDNEIIKKYLKIDTNVDEISKRTSLIFVNQHFALSGNRPLTQQVIEIGGVHIQEAENENSIPEKIEKFLSNSKVGVIFISWGSMIKANTIPLEKFQAIVNFLKSLPYDVIWKWEDDNPPIKNEKFYFVKWAPQKSLLCHPKVKVFWSHGGLLGTSESVYCAKPIVVTPIYGDQFLNGMAVVNRKMGTILDFNNLNEGNIRNAFETVFSQSYMENAKQVSLMYRTRPNSPLNTSLWWIEHIINSKGNNLLFSTAVELNWFNYHSLDSISVLIIIIIVIIKIVLILFHKCFYKAKYQISKNKSGEFREPPQESKVFSKDLRKKKHK